MRILFLLSIIGCIFLASCAPNVIEIDRTVSTACKPILEKCWPSLVSQGFILEHEQLKSENTVLKKDIRDCQASQNRR
jgi:hypothetical protein